MTSHYDPSKTEMYRRTTATMGSTEGITLPRRKCSTCGGHKSNIKRVGGSGSRLDPWRYKCHDCSGED